MIDKLFSFNFVLQWLIWVPIAIWVYSLIAWAIQGEIEGLVALFGVVLALAMGLACWKAPSPEVPPVLFLVSFSGLVLYPFVRDQHANHQLSKMDIESVERAYEQLRARPDNIGAKFRIARTLFKRGAHDAAIALAEGALEGKPAVLFEDEHKQLKQWQRSLPYNHRPAQHVTCFLCGKRNDLGAVYCKSCHSALLLHYAKRTWITANLAKKLISAWMAAVTLFGGILYVSMHINAPTKYVGIGLLCAAAAVMIFLGFRTAADSS